MVNVSGILIILHRQDHCSRTIYYVLCTFCYVLSAHFNDQNYIYMAVRDWIFNGKSVRTTYLHATCKIEGKYLSGFLFY